MRHAIWSESDRDYVTPSDVLDPNDSEQRRPPRSYPPIRETDPDAAKPAPSPEVLLAGFRRAIAQKRARERSQA